ncbi:MAG TPA: type IV secretion protein IcmD [Gammaproteobacteria bacterium]|nr:type IV secretion protein IcmD [Gammaproteobacteria bacterium]
MSTVVQKRHSNSLLVLLAYFGVLLALFLISEFAFAGGKGGGRDLGEVASGITKSMVGMQKLLSAAAYIAGLGFAIAGMMKFKAHKDQPAQVPLSQPITLLLVAAGLVFLPSLISTAGETIFKSGSATDAEGGGF